MFPSSGSQQWPHTASGEPQLCEKQGKVPHDGYWTDVEEAAPESAAFFREVPGGQHVPATAHSPLQPLL